ncbi:MAG: glycosyltransferase [Clostridiales bacterium]|nr:glycosyltransferase [Clostridiales bacterium]
MKICLVHEEYPEETNFGGIATYQKRVAEEYVRLGHQVIVIARGLKENQHYFENGVEIYRLFNEPTGRQIEDYTNYRQMVANLLLELQNDGIEIIEVPDWGAESVLFEKDRKIPLVVRLHTPLKVWLKFNKNNFGEVTNQMLTWEEYALLQANLVTCCSNILKEIICKDFPLKPKDILVTPNPANLTNFFKDENIQKTNSLLYVGSLEERKGVVVLAKALNIFFKKFPKVKCYFIGKDTTRNSQNISTKEYIKSLVNEEYRSNLEFLGQLPNTSLNEFYNKCNVAIFPSLFDNFPYVTLEAMSTGIHIVGSKNSGMVEMLNNKNSIYNTPSHKNLAKKIITKFKLSQKSKYDVSNIQRVKTMYSSQVVCKNMLALYEKTIRDYKLYNITTSEIQKVLNACNINREVKAYKRNSSGVANAVIEILTNNENYVIKRYNSNVNFNLSQELQQTYTTYGINVCAPINKNVLTINNNKYNIFNYIKGKHVKLNKNLFNFLSKIVSLNRKTNLTSTINLKCENYYNILKNANLENSNIAQEIKYVIKRYEQIKQHSFVNECYLNHGDLSSGNILICNNNYYVIDFDEALVGPKLYDFAVICIKFFMRNEKINKNLFNKLKNKLIQENHDYKEQDFNNIIVYYLCKILLEKFALHLENKIDLFSIRQKQDYFEKYLNILKEM